MKIQELEKKLLEINAPKDLYSILKGGLPNEQYCITKSGKGFEVYYSERGNKSELKVFDVEDMACQHFLKKIKELF